MGCEGYRDQPCECEDGGLLFNDNHELRTVESRPKDAWPKVICRRCNCVSKAVLHVDYNLQGSPGTPGDHGIPEGLKGVSGKPGPHGVNVG